MQLTAGLEQFIGKRAVRRAVVETAIAATGAFSADELYAMTRRRQPTIGRATIYRTLRRLCDRKFFRETILRSGTRVYQQAGDPRHVLWICDDCSSIRSLPADGVIEALHGLAEKRGWCLAEMTVEVHSRCERMRLHGACHGCGQDLL